MSRKEIKYGNPLMFDFIMQNHTNSDDNNGLLHAISEIPKLYEEVEEMIKNNEMVIKD